MHEDQPLRITRRTKKQVDDPGDLSLFPAVSMKGRRVQWTLLLQYLFSKDLVPLSQASMASHEVLMHSKTWRRIGKKRYAPNCKKAKDERCECPDCTKWIQLIKGATRFVRGNNGLELLHFSEQIDEGKRPFLALGNFKVGKGRSGFDYPSGMSYDPTNQIFYIVDTFNHRIKSYSLQDYNLLSIVGGPDFGYLAGKYFQPGDVCVYEDELYITDSRNYRIQIRTSKGIKIITEGLVYPLGISVTEEFIFVTDLTEGLVIFNRKNHSYLKTIESSKDLLLNQAMGIDVDKANKELYIADTSNHRFLVMDFNGTLLRTLGGDGRGAGKYQFKWPEGVCVDQKPKGLVYCSDLYNHRIQVYNKQGEYMDTIQMPNFFPSGLMIIDTTLYVSDRYQHSVLAFKVPCAVASHH